MSQSEKPSDEILTRIRKILSRTEQAGCTPAEAEAAFAKASRMLAEHNLTMEDVAAPQGGSEPFIEADVHETGRWSLEDNFCYAILKEFYFVEGFFDRTDGNRKLFRIFGRPENVETARFVWSALHASFERCWTMYRVLSRKPASERRLYVAGMAKGYMAKLREEREAQIIERDAMSGKSGGTALALASIADKTLAAYKQAHPHHKPGRGRRVEAQGETSTLQAGYEAGRSLNLNRAVGASKRKALA